MDEYIRRVDGMKERKTKGGREGEELRRLIREKEGKKRSKEDGRM